MISTSKFGKKAGSDPTVPGHNKLGLDNVFSDVYLKSFKRFPEKSIENMWFKIFCLLKEYTNAKLKRSSLKL